METSSIYVAVNDKISKLHNRLYVDVGMISSIHSVDKKHCNQTINSRMLKSVLKEEN